MKTPSVDCLLAMSSSRESTTLLLDLVLFDSELRCERWPEPPVVLRGILSSLSGILWKTSFRFCRVTPLKTESDTTKTNFQHSLNTMSFKSIIANAIQNLHVKYAITNPDAFTNDLCMLLGCGGPVSSPPPAAPPAAPAVAPVEEKKKREWSPEAKAAAAAKRAANKAAKTAEVVVLEEEDAPQQPKNMSKISPTDEKRFKKALAGMHREITDQSKKELLDYINGLPAADFNSAKFEQHVINFLTPKSNAAPAPEVKVSRLRTVMRGKTYWIDEHTKKVYRNEEDEEDVTCLKHVGEFGLHDFRDMVWPEPEEDEEE